MMKDKDIDSVLSQIAPLFKKIYTVTVSNPRSIVADELKQKAEKYCAEVISCDDLSNAINNLKSSNEDFVICGSLYLCSDALKELES